MRVHIDPPTGEVLQGPPPAAADTARAAQDAAASSYRAARENMTMRPSPVPGGGTLLDTRGLRRPLVATVDESGNVRIIHGRPSADTHK